MHLWHWHFFCMQCKSHIPSPLQQDMCFHLTHTHMLTGTYPTPYIFPCVVFFFSHLEHLLMRILDGTWATFCFFNENIFVPNASWLHQDSIKSTALQWRVGDKLEQCVLFWFFLSWTFLSCAFKKAVHPAEMDWFTRVTSSSFFFLSLCNW